jgi:hypothetical protein
MKVKLTPVSQFGRDEFKPSNELAKTIARWLGKKHLSESDKEFIKEIGLEPVVLTFKEVD